MNDVWDFPMSLPITPCTGKCAIQSSTGYCAECFMTLKEATEWEKGYLTSAEQEGVIEKCKERKNAS